MKLSFSDNFTFDITKGDEEIIINGSIQRLTKKQETEIKNKFKKEYSTLEKIGDLAKKAQREKLRAELSENQEEAKAKGSEMLDKLYDLQDGIDEDKFKEEIAKFRFDLSVTSKQLPELIEIAEMFGYAFVIEMINKDVEDRKNADTPT